MLCYKIFCDYIRLSVIICFLVFLVGFFSGAKFSVILREDNKSLFVIRLQLLTFRLFANNSSISLNSSNDKFNSFKSINFTVFIRSKYKNLYFFCYKIFCYVVRFDHIYHYHYHYLYLHCSK